MLELLMSNYQTFVSKLAYQAKGLSRLVKLRNTIASKLPRSCISSLDMLKTIDQNQAKIIYDIGANVGTWSLLAKAVFPHSVIHAFEPLNNHVIKFRELTSNVSDVSLHQIALGSQNKMAKMQITNFSDSSSLLLPTTEANQEYGIIKSSEIEVNIITLDEYILINNLPFPDLIKLDVQGYELEVFKGAQKCLNQAKYILCEVSFREYYHQQPLFHHIANFLDDYGYRVELLGNDNIFMTPCTQMDVLFYRY